MKVRDLIKKIEQDGWYQVSQEGSHRRYKHSVRGGKVTVSGHLADEIHPKTLNSILKQAELK
jgi:predicted RNA binding protein YcfA (HicA-like mRNA interferase family)